MGSVSARALPGTALALVQHIRVVGEPALGAFTPVRDCPVLSSSSGLVLCTWLHPPALTHTEGPALSPASQNLLPHRAVDTVPNVPKEKPVGH